MMRRFSILLLSATCAGCAFALPSEWLLVRDGVRDCLVATLELEGRFEELDFLESVWAGDCEAAEAAARVLVDRTGDQTVTRWLARYLRRTGREAEAAAVAPPPRLLRAPTPSSAAPTAATDRRPVVFLHGYNGSAETWLDFVTLFLEDGYSGGDLLVLEYGVDVYDGVLPCARARYDGNEDTPIGEISAWVAPKVRTWLRLRDGVPEDDESHDAKLPAPDWICHSMGGLVFRHVLKSDPELVHRCVNLGTPHFGQPVGEVVGTSALTGFQTEQMAHGSTFLWDLAADWHYRGHRTDDILFIVGVAATDAESGLALDGLVNAFSATMLSQADGAAFASRTFYVNRVHSDMLWFLEYFGSASGDGLVSLRRGMADPVFRLACGYLNGTGYFADGAVPSQRQVLADDGAVDVDGILERVRGQGALFAQVMEPVTNTAAHVQHPVEYSPGGWLSRPDKVVEGLSTPDGKEYTDEDEGLLRGNGYNDEGCVNGLVLLYGDIPTGTVFVAVGEPSGYRGPYSLPYFALATINGGGTTLWRTRPGSARPMSAVAVADGAGRVRTLAVTNSWLASAGLVASAEDLEGCVAAAAATAANGCPAALSALLGLDPSDPESRVRFDGVGLDGDIVKLSLRAGERSLPPEAPFALQGRPALDEEWCDLSDVTRTPGRWETPVSASRFFRAVLRW